jgi:hypothetical protein
MLKRFFTILIIFLSVLAAVARSDQYFQYIYPIPDSKYISTETTLIFRFNEKWQNVINPSILAIDVKGQKSGVHPGKIILADDQKTIIFKPFQKFALHETVFVEIDINLGEEIRKVKYTFTTSNSGIDEKVPNSYNNCLVQSRKSQSPTETYGEMSVINGMSVPSDFPKIEIDILKETAPGKIFMANRFGSPYMMILENDGTPYFYRRVESSAWLFTRQANNSLSYWDLKILPGSFVVLDTNFKVIDTLNCSPIYLIDNHEFQLLRNGHYFLIANEFQIMDMSQLVDGGDSSAIVYGKHVVEFDSNDNIIFIWRSWDHFNILDAIHVDLTASRIDYVHMNAIALDYDNNILISSRNLSEITKIDRYTGEIIWRLGGVNDDFTWANDEYGISYQHDIRPVPNKPNYYTLFDNGNYHEPRFSRAIELQIDTLSMTVTKVWEYRHSPDRYANGMGNVQRLPNENTLINWSQNILPKATEVTENGEIVYEMNFEENNKCYRTFRFEWEGVALVPYLIVESRSDKVTLIFNKFGDKGITNYRIYGGIYPKSDQLLASSSEPFIHFSHLHNNQTYYFRVTAVDSNGTESDFSNEEEVFVKFIEPGENFILNGDFSDSTEYWEFNKSSSAVASGIVQDSIYHIKIDSNAVMFSDVQLYQNNLEIIEGRNYILEFDAWSTKPKLFDMRIRQSADPFTDYSRIGTVYSTTNKQHFYYEFRMEYTTDYSAQIVFECGQSTADLYIDNVSLIYDPTETVITANTLLPKIHRLYPNYPNPFNPSTKIKFTLPNPENVRIEVYNTIGQKIETLLHKNMSEGYHEVEFNAQNLSSGIYFYRIEAGEFQDVKKMILLR